MEEKQKWDMELTEVPNPVKKKSYYYLTIMDKQNRENTKTYVLTKTNYEEMKKQQEIWKQDTERAKSTGKQNKQI